MTFRTGLLVATILAATPAGCGGGSASGGGTVSCTTVDTQTTGGMLKTCQEGAGGSQISQIVQAGCVSQGDVDAGFTETVDFEKAPCSRDGAVGGCRYDSGGGTSITLWFYNLANQHQTAADVMASCATDGSTFVAP